MLAIAWVLGRKFALAKLNCFVFVADVCRTKGTENALVVNPKVFLNRFSCNPFSLKEKNILGRNVKNENVNPKIIPFGPMNV